VALFLGGCFEPVFNIEPPKRHEITGSDSVKSTGNRVSNKYLPDSVHGDDKGLFFNPSYIKLATGQTGFAFNIEHTGWCSCAKNFHPAFKKMKIIEFTIDGEKKSHKVMNAKYDCTTGKYYQGNSINTFLETGYMTFNEGEYEAIMNAENFEFRVIGDYLSETYTTKDISKNFIPNLKEFYEKVKGEIK
jgi:hypothetical protein